MKEMDIVVIRCQEATALQRLWADNGGQLHHQLKGLATRWHLIRRTEVGGYSPDEKWGCTDLLVDFGGELWKEQAKNIGGEKNDGTTQYTLYEKVVQMQRIIRKFFKGCESDYTLK